MRADEDTTTEPDGFAEPIYLSLADPPRFGGVPLRTAGVTICIFGFLGSVSTPLFLVGALVHILTAYVTRRDFYALEMFRECLTYRNRYRAFGEMDE